MYIPKRYGESKKQPCPFCGKQSVTQNKQGVPVCIKHKGDLLDMKCICGEWLDVKSGKWGPYFTCPKCGNISFAKAMEANPDIASRAGSSASKDDDTPKQFKAKPAYKAEKETKKEMTITSDELDFYF